jgi:hypothetical protein
MRAADPRRLQPGRGALSRRPRHSAREIHYGRKPCGNTNRRENSSYKRAQACLIVDSEETMQEEEEGKEAAAL